MNELEHQLASARDQPALFAAAPVAEPARHQENLLLIHAELDAPREPRLARILRRLGVPDLSVPLVTATPALRRSWFVAVTLAVLFSLSVASSNTAAGAERIAVFLTLAPLLPLLGVALAFGKGVDPTHDLVVAAPRDTFVVFLVRAITVLTASSAVLLVSSLGLPEGGVYRVAWLLPALAIASVSMALSTRFEPRRVAAIVAATWVVLVLIVAGAQSTEVMFGGVTQIISIAVAAAGAVFLFRRRDHLDTVRVLS